MSRKIRVATFTRCVSLSDKPANQDILDFIIEKLDTDLKAVFRDKPDLVVLPEAADFPCGLPDEDFDAFLERRGNKVLDFLKDRARENRCYIAYSTYRTDENGVRRNSSIMIDRAGELLGAYDKNHPVLDEMDDKNVIPSDEATVFECDFGRVGALICFDINFYELREKYKKLKPDLVVFQSNFCGGLMRNFFAFDTRSFLVAACGYYDCPAAVISPLGDNIKVSSGHYNYIVEEINLDFAVCHLDNNREKIAAAKEKYGSALVIRDPGYIGVISLSYDGNDKTVLDIIKEFDIMLADDYFAVSRKHREEILAKNINL